MRNKAKANDEEVLNLYEYFIWADSMKTAYENLLERNLREIVPIAKFEAEYNLFISYWFGGLYVVIEGWQELNLKDREIDSLLTSPNVNLLRRYRNGVFHFQRDYFDERFMGFLRDGVGRIKWVQVLHGEFKRFFVEWSQKHKALISA